MSRFTGERRMVALVGLWALAMGPGMGKTPFSWGRVAEVTPKTHHAPLTSITDGESGYLVQPGSPLVVDLVGPGNLTVTLRLNHTSRRAAIAGEVEILRERRIIKKFKLNLISSRVGNYREDASLHMSLPKVLRLAVPVGTHAYGLVLRAARGTSMTVQLIFETSLEQGAAKEGGDSLSLVPLVPPAAPEKDKNPDDLALAEPLLKKQPDRHPATTPGMRKRLEEGAGNSDFNPSAEESAPAEDSVSVLKTDESEQADAFVPVQPAEEATPRKGKDPTRSRSSKKSARAARGSGAVMSIGIKGGQISPMQKIGGTSITGGLEITYLALESRLGVGVEAGYYRYRLDITTAYRQMTLQVIPIALQVFYRFVDASSRLGPFLGCGVDAFVLNGTDKRSDVPYSVRKGSGVAFGGHLSLGLEYRLGRGRFLGEIRGGLSLGEAVVWKKANVSGVTSSAGYRFEF